MAAEPADKHPIAIVEDRDTGTDSGGRWLAIAPADRIDGEHSRVEFVLSDRNVGPHGDDSEAMALAMAFRAYPPDWIAVADTPQQALDRLNRGIFPTLLRRPR